MSSKFHELRFIEPFEHAERHEGLGQHLAGLNFAERDTDRLGHSPHNEG